MKAQILRQTTSFSRRSMDLTQMIMHKKVLGSVLQQLEQVVALVDLGSSKHNQLLEMDLHSEEQHP